MKKTMRKLILTSLLLLAGTTVLPAQTNVAPVVFVDGESDYLGRGVFMHCSVQDEGAVTYLWSKVSGPGVVAFSAPQKSMTHAQFSTSGLYTIKCSVSDGQFVVADQMVIMASSMADIAVKP